MRLQKAIKQHDQHKETMMFNPAILLGKPKSAILALFDDCIEFGYWLYVPTLGVVLSFDKQICASIGRL